MRPYSRTSAVAFITTDPKGEGRAGMDAGSCQICVLRSKTQKLKNGREAVF
jgi:hypothetical protein